MKWFPVVGYAFRVLNSRQVQAMHIDAMYRCTDAANAYVEMLKTVKEKFPEVDGYTNHDVIVLDYPEFTITKGRE